MPLRRMSQSVYTLPNSDDLYFTMMDAENGDAVPISVSAAALRKLDDTATPIEAFDNYRTVLEETASNKFDNQGAPQGVIIDDVDLVGG